MARTSNVVKADFGRGAKPVHGKDDPLSALEALTKDAKAGLSKKDKEKIEKFGKQFKRLAKQTGADAKNFRADITQKALYRTMMAMVIGMVPTAQEKYMEVKTESALYSVNTLLNQIQQLALATRQLDTLEEQADYVVIKIVTPMLERLLQGLMQSTFTMKSTIDTVVTDPKKNLLVKKRLDDLVKEHASFLSENQRALKAAIESYLVGDT